MFNGIINFTGKVSRVIFKNKQGKEYNIELSRLIRVFNNNIWQHTKSVK